MNKNWQAFFLILIIASIILPPLLGPWYLTFLIAGGYLLVGGFYLVAKEHVSKRWPTTQGRIIASKVVAVQSFDSGDEPVPNVRYKYSVDGHKFQGDKISLTSKSPFSWKSVTKTLRETRAYSSAEKIVKRYPLGSKVLVYYNPRNPSESVIQLGVESWILLLFFFLSAVFIGVGLLKFFGII